MFKIWLKLMKISHNLQKLVENIWNHQTQRLQRQKKQKWPFFRPKVLHDQAASRLVMNKKHTFYDTRKL